MNDNTITFYYYTAWDGFSWQGCDEATANSLQLYMEATKTLPKSSADRPPFGGAVPCKINGKVGVAVYRYHTRVKGDLSGRDSLYIALAFVPLGAGCVDFAKLLDLPQLAATQAGELDIQSAPVGELRLDGELKLDWQDKGLDDDYLVLDGRNGLQKLSRLFFSEKTQLGFLNAVFRAESGRIDDIESTQTYSVCPQVKEVAAASEMLEDARKRGRGALAAGEPAFDALKNALADLDKWARKQPDYRGLRDYYNKKESELRGEAERLQAIQRFVDELQAKFDYILKLKRMCGSSRVDDMLAKELAKEQGLIVECMRKAREVMDVLFPDVNDPCRQALQRSLDALEGSSYAQGVQKGLEYLQTVKDEWKKTINAQAEAERKNADLRQDNKSLEEQVKDLRKQVNQLEKQLENLGGKPQGGGVAGKTSPSVSSGSSGGRKPRFWWFDNVYDWAMPVVVAIAILALGFLVWLTFFSKPKHTDSGSGRLDDKTIETMKQEEQGDPEPSKTGVASEGGRDGGRAGSSNNAVQTVVPGSTTPPTEASGGDNASVSKTNDVLQVRGEDSASTPGNGAGNNNASQKPTNEVTQVRSDATGRAIGNSEPATNSTPDSTKKTEGVNDEKGKQVKLDENKGRDDNKGRRVENKGRDDNKGRRVDNKGRRDDNKGRSGANPNEKGKNQ